MFIGSMGLDGGTIPSRTDLLRRSSWRLVQNDKSRSTRGGEIAVRPDGGGIRADPTAVARSRLTTCSLTGDPLSDPVACRLGRLYNRDAVVEFLLQKGRFLYCRKELKNQFRHLSSRSCVFDVHLKVEGSEKADIQDGREGMFECPITGLPSNGVHTFVAFRPCGHVVSDRALEQIKGRESLDVCTVCSETTIETVPLNPEKEKLEERLKIVLDNQSRKRHRDSSDQSLEDLTGSAQPSSTSLVVSVLSDRSGASSKKTSRSVIMGTAGQSRCCGDSGNEMTVVENKQVKGRPKNETREQKRARKEARKRAKKMKANIQGEGMMQRISIMGDSVDSGSQPKDRKWWAL